MGFYVVVHHRRDSHQPWSNTWLDDDRLQLISTTADIAARCDLARRTNERVFVHRCAWDGGPALICCSVAVKTAGYEEKLGWVEFCDAEIVNHPPTHHPGRGQNCYEGDVPSSKPARAR